MFTTLVAVIAALVLGHVAPATVASLRRFSWFSHWLEWLGAQSAQRGLLAGRYGIALALLPPVLLVLAVQLALKAPWFGLPGLLFGLLVLIYAWGPRDLDVDVEAVLDALDPQSRRERLLRLAPEPGVEVVEGPSAAEAVVRSGLRRWFGVLFWFLLLGPAGALLYRLSERAVVAQGMPALGFEAQAGARRWLQWMEWPVAQLMTLTLALAGNFDVVFRAWRGAGGDRWTPDAAFLGAAARAAVSGELAEELADDLRDGLVPVLADLAELRDAMSLVWRMLLLWLALLALLIIAGWVH